MTRENKLALVVGFGLLLLVGILVSDHFSPARVESAEDLRAGRGPEAAVRPEWMRTPAAPVAPVAPAAPATDGGRGEPDPATDATGGGDARPFLASDERALDRPRDRRTAAGRAEAGSPPPPQPIPTRPHVVARGETLERIAVDAYGDRELAKALAAFNGIDDPRRLRAGATIQLPPEAMLRRGTDVPAEAREAAESPDPAWRTYVVQRGDTLSEIARRELGRRDWQAILEANRDVLAHEDDLRPGMTLRLPPRRG